VKNANSGFGLGRQREKSGWMARNTWTAGRVLPEGHAPDTAAMWNMRTGGLYLNWVERAVPHRRE